MTNEPWNHARNYAASNVSPNFAGSSHKLSGKKGIVSKTPSRLSSWSENNAKTKTRVAGTIDAETVSSACASTQWYNIRILDCLSRSLVRRAFSWR